jgi:hypothetical protein
MAVIVKGNTAIIKNKLFLEIKKSGLPLIYPNISLKPDYK